MEVRIARLEAHVEHITSEVGKLAGLPAEVARISERLNHMPIKSEMYEAIEAAVDRSSARLQRTIAVVGAMVAIVSGVVTYLVKIAG